MNYNSVLVEKSNSICYITINRPKQLNALSISLISELNSVITDAERDKNIRCIILTGSGEKAFAAGADIKEFISFNKKEGENLSRNGQKKLFDLLDNLQTPSIALINGFALGGGLELAMSCHIRIAWENARMGLPEVTLGLIPGYGGTQRLTNLVGKGKALEMILTGSMINSTEAKELGLVNYICSKEEGLNIANRIASKIVQNSPKAIAKAIKSVNACFIDGQDGFETEKQEFGSCFETNDFMEGTKAFMEKRKPKF